VSFTKVLKPVHSIQLVTDGDFDRRYAESGIRVMGYERFLSGLL
jgi:hypothetical protein